MQFSIVLDYEDRVSCVWKYRSYIRTATDTVSHHRPDQVRELRRSSASGDCRDILVHVSSDLPQRATPEIYMRAGLSWAGWTGHSGWISRGSNCRCSPGYPAGLDK